MNLSFRARAVLVRPCDAEKVQRSAKGAVPVDRRVSDRTAELEDSFQDLLDLRRDRPTPGPSRESEMTHGAISPSPERRPLKSCMARLRRSDLPRRTKAVCFGRIEVRTYPVVLGDNPSPSSGAPVALGWDHDPLETFELDVVAYETCRDNGVIHPRTKAELRLPPEVREGMLLEAGHSRREVRRAAGRVREGRRRGRASLRLRKLDPLLERAEGLRRGCAGRMVPRRTDQGRDRDGVPNAYAASWYMGWGTSAM